VQTLFALSCKIGGMKTMPNSTQEERLRWIKPILDRDISIKKMARISLFSKRSLKYWIKNFQLYGEASLVPKSTRPKTQPSETPIRIKERVVELRKETELGAQKLHFKLFKEGLNIPVRTIGKILRDEGLVRKYRTRKIKLKYVKVPLLPGELVEIDIKEVPTKIEGGKYYQFTAIDCASRWRYLAIYESPSNACSVLFLKNLIEVAPFRIRAIKTDNESCFTNRYTGYLKSADSINPRLHAFDLVCQSRGIIHYLIDPGKPAQNGRVERSHGVDQQHFYNKTTAKTLEELKLKTKLWNMYYNDLEHIALLGKTPNEYLKEKVQNVLV